MSNMADALAAKREAQRRLSDVSGLRGIGIGWDDDGQPNVLVNVDLKELDEVRNRLANSILGVPVRIETVGPIKAE
jgi:hypothetical protein